MKGLRLGAVVLLDALGFKGIWNRLEPNDVLRQLKRIKQEGVGLQGKDRGGVLLRAEAFDHRVKCISDTIIIVVTVRGSSSQKFPERPLFGTMLAATWIASSVVDFALRGFPPLLFRGCMTAGRVNMDGDFLIGPAVDEAAEFFEKSDGPFFWMAPSSLEINNRYADTFFERIEHDLMTRYSVPMKDGTSSQTLAHHHFCLRDAKDRWALTRARIISAFGAIDKHPDIIRKRENVLAFLDHIQHAAASPDNRRDFNVRLPYLEDLTPDQRLHILIHDGIEGLRSFPRSESSGDLFPSPANDTESKVNRKKSP